VSVAGTVDMWRVMMSLRSGLACETVWALDVISILLADATTASTFNLANLPGLLEVLLDHFRHYLLLAFGSEFEDLEISSEVQSRYARSSSDDDNDEDIVDENAIHSIVKKEDPTEVENNYTLKTHDGRDVRVDSETPMDDSLIDAKHWDKDKELDSSGFDWQMGRGDTTRHIVNSVATSNLFCSKQFFGRVYQHRSVARQDLKASDISCHVPYITNTALLPSKSSVHVESKTDPQSSDVKIEHMSDVDESESVTVVVIKRSVSETDCCKQSSGLSTDKSQFDLPKFTNFDNFKATQFSCTQLELLKQSYAELDEQVYRPNDAACQLTTRQSEIARRCVTLSNIIRNLSFLSGNEVELCRHSGVLMTFGKLLLLHHRHPSHGSRNRTNPSECVDRPSVSAESEKIEKTDSDLEPGILPASEEVEWWWETLEEMRDNAMVVFANVCGHLDLTTVAEEICLPILDGLLHWSVCSSLFPPSTPPTVSLQYLAIEALCKLCVVESNTDLLLATPPFSRVVCLMTNLVTMLGDRRTPVFSEFAVSLLSCLTPADPSVARALALQRSAVSFLLEFIEEAERSMVERPVVPAAAASGGRGSVRRAETLGPDATGTSIDMVCRAANILRHITDVTENVPLVLRHEERLKHLAMSQVLDLRVTSVLASVLGACSS